eukprot:TRINITY_DN55339_c0_g1_i1.p1 TRINITY_DN55339_c0_g1~~TRINITY_DN55339_c0_g1_i1.p1  ORF type:complete len:341 (-),score=100.73 TRINITY_DN55339_c0_g1_i1:63-1019(-)
MALWQRCVRAGSPVVLEASTELDSCCLVSGKAATLLCAAARQPKRSFAAARLGSDLAPCTPLRLRLEPGARLSCEEGGAAILVMGRSASGAEEDIEELPAAKRPRTQKSPQRAPVAAAAAGVDVDDRRAALRAAQGVRAAAAEAVRAQARAEAEAQRREEERKEALIEAQRKDAEAKAEAAAEASKAKEKAKAAAASASEPPAAVSGAAGSRTTLPSGLQCEVLRTGTGNGVTSGKSVNVRYEGRLAKTGKIFDKGTIKFRLGKGEVIRGWDEGVRGMKVGEQRRLRVPAHLGYGRRGFSPKIPPNADLVFVVCLLSC